MCGILWKGTVTVEFGANCPKFFENCACTQNFHTRKLGEISVFYVVYASWFNPFLVNVPILYSLKTEKQFFLVFPFQGVQKLARNGKSFWRYLPVHWKLYLCTYVLICFSKILEVCAYHSNIMPSQLILGMLIVKLLK